MKASDYSELYGQLYDLSKKIHERSMEMAVRDGWYNNQLSATCLTGGSDKLKAIAMAIITLPYSDLKILAEALTPDTSRYTAKNHTMCDTLLEAAITIIGGENESK